MSQPSEARRRARDSWERRFQAKGSRSLTIRLSGVAHEQLELLARGEGVSRREVLERLIMAASPMTYLREIHGLSDEEARYMAAMNARPRNSHYTNEGEKK
jgi:hypothetical protein